MSLAAAAANRLVALCAVRAHARLRHALADPGAAQGRVFRRLVSANAATAFGAAHGFGSIRTVDDYRRRVPVRTYDELRPWLDRVEAGEPNTLAAEAVLWLEPSGGSSGPSKLVPFTAGLRAEFSAATLPWLADLHRSRPRLRTGTAYWAISPPARRPAASGGGVRIGAAADGDYFPSRLRGVLARGQAVPPDVATAGDMDACRRATVAALAAADDLAFISVWSPTFLSLLVESLDEHWDTVRALVADRTGRRRRLPPAPPEDLGELWPRLSLISCWADGHAGRALGPLRRRFPAVDIQPKGLLATEGAVSIPLHDAPAPVAAVTSHLLEFLAGGDAYLADELDTGGTYEVVLSTAGGLYRYRLGDLVRVEGHLGATPLLRFAGRADGRVDLAGEKLTPAFVEAALAAAETTAGVACRFAVLAPHPGGRGYVLTVEPLALAADPHADAGRLAAALERELGAAYHYRLARDVGQLEPVAGRAVAHADRLWEASRMARGQRAGAVKPPVLVAEPFPQEPACAVR